MIYVKKEDVAEKSFVDLLAKTKKNVLFELTKQGAKAKQIDPVPFENFVYERMVFSSKNTNFDGNLIQTGPHAFPDVIARKFFGVEVKMTTADKWVSTGNSVLETTRVEDVRRIYLFFGKFGGKIDIRYKPYQDCLYDIGVTHSPRYKINMDLGDNSSIFHKMGVEYDVLRQEPNLIRKIKDYYRAQLKEGEELWWIDAQTEDVSVSPVIKPFRKLSRNEQKMFTVESMILFPEMFSSSTLKFERAAVYLITTYNAVSSNLRDNFTAGGQATINIGKKKVIVPKIFYHLSVVAKDIAHTINAMDEEKLKYYWRVSRLEKSKITQWKEMLDRNSELNGFGLKASDIFDTGLI